MPDLINVRVSAGEVERELRLIAERSDGIHLGELAEEVKLQVDNKIQAEGALFGAPRWTELSASTLAQRPGARMLQHTGLLANLQAAVDVSGGTRGLVVSSPAPYAGFHVTGTFRRGQPYMPRRDFFDLDYDQVLEAVGARVLERIVS